MSNLPEDPRRVNPRVKRSSIGHTNVTLLELVQADVPLIERRGEWWGCCPFHPDKTPSFSVNAEKGVYSCFGCGAKGDAIEYLRQRRGYSFAEAADAVGKERPPPRHEGKRQRDEEERRRYWEWWQEKMRDWNALLDDIRTTEYTYRDQCLTLGEAMSDASYRFWSKRLGDLYFQQTVMQQLLDLTDAERFAAWREEAGE